MTRKSVAGDCAPDEHRWSIAYCIQEGTRLKLFGSCMRCGCIAEGETSAETPDLTQLSRVMLPSFDRED